MPGQTDGWKDGQTLFQRSLAATAGGPKILRKTISIIWYSYMTKGFMIQKTYSKMYSASCANMHQDVRTFDVVGMV